jgi:replicative DNA helicase
LELDKDKTIRKTVQLEPGVQFDDKNTVMDSLPIKTGLIEALDELRDMIMTKFKPVEMLNKATVKQYDITKRTNANEAVNIAEQVIKKINNIKKLKK